PIKPGTVDIAFFSQALHHAQHPKNALAAAHQMLKPGGRIVVLDLVKHNFEKARQLYADVWLGFSEVELHEMLEDAGFKDIEIRTVDRESRSPHFQTLLAVGQKG